MTTCDAFIASLEHCPDKDLFLISKTLEETLPERADDLRAANNVPVKHRATTLRKILQGVLSLRGEELRRPYQQHDEPRQTRTLEMQEDHALRCAQASLGGLSDQKWEEIAEHKNMPVEAARRDVWRRVYTGFRDND